MAPHQGSGMERQYPPGAVALSCEANNPKMTSLNFASGPNGRFLDNT
jgi:hypothetical protein